MKALTLSQLVFHLIPYTLIVNLIIILSSRSTRSSRRLRDFLKAMLLVATPGLLLDGMRIVKLRSMNAKGSLERI